jgi:hypothetical protein
MSAAPTATRSTLSLSERWMPVEPGKMPPDDLTVIVWNGTTGAPCAVFFDSGLDCWILQSDPTTIHEGAITHWRYCNGPDVIDIMSADNDRAVAKVPAPDIIVSAPYSRVRIDATEAADHIGMRARQLAAILHVMPTAGYSEPMAQLASRLARDLVAEIEAGGGALLAAQLAELLLVIQDDNGPCVLLWLCQQIANELDEAILGMITEGGAT